jgi:hypothetical protein
MNKLFKSTLLIATMFLASLGMSQTNFSAPRFSASFNGAVETSKAARNTNNTSTSVQYTSTSGNVLESVTVRTIDHDIAVDSTSSQFYRANDTTGTLFPASSSDGTYQGHPYSYGCAHFESNGITFWSMTRYIIVDSRTAIFITLIVPENDVQLSNNETLPEWVRFENSLSIQ